MMPLKGQLKAFLPEYLEKDTLQDIKMDLMMDTVKVILMVSQME